MKWNSTGNCLAGDVITFVDDGRVTGSSKENCWGVYHQFASRMQFLGLQNAPRKFRPPLLKTKQERGPEQSSELTLVLFQKLCPKKNSARAAIFSENYRTP